MKNILRLFLTVTVFILLIPQDSYAYIDPGTGSYVLQILIASVLGGLFVLKASYRKIINFFKSLFTDNKSTKIDE
ncbi:MAG: hypothetical protein ACI8PB_002584 [Desulforhopalus sp.]|jgi:hypothetical protein